MNFQQKQKNFIWQTLVLQNCLTLSQPAKFTSKNITQYLLGNRNKINIFKYDHLKHLLLKIAPIISTLFHSHMKIKNKFGRSTYIIPAKPPRDPNKLIAWQKRMNQLKKFSFKKYQYFYKTIENKKPIKILFATTNPVFKKIIKSAANLCNMPFHTDRWLCGSLTANSRSKNHIIKNNTKTDKIEAYFNFKYRSNKELPVKKYSWHKTQKQLQRPTIAIIPDIHNNDMILRETNILKIPIIGLINSDCNTQITYPIFGNANSLQIVHFFCHFIAVLIAKEVIQQDYKTKSHRIFAKTRWQLRKEFIKLNRFAQRNHKTPYVFKSSRLFKRTYKKWNKVFLKYNLKKKRWNSKRLYRTYRKQRLLQRTFTKFKEQLKKRRGRLIFNTIKRQNMRKRFNEITGNRFYTQKNLTWLLYESAFYSDVKYIPKQEITLALIIKLLRAFKHKNMTKNKLNKFFQKQSALTYIFLNILQLKPKTKYQDAHKINFFEYVSNNRKIKSSLSLTWLKKENLITNESLWRNAYWTYFRSQNKKNKVRSRLSRRTKARKFKYQIRFVRVNKAYYWESTNKLRTNNQIQRLTRIFVKSQTRNYLHLRMHLWYKVSRYFNKKKRSYCWIPWRFRKEINILNRRLKFKKRFKNKKKPNKRWKTNKNLPKLVTMDKYKSQTTRVNKLKSKYSNNTKNLPKK